MDAPPPPYEEAILPTSPTFYQYFNTVMLEEELPTRTATDLGIPYSYHDDGLSQQHMIGSYCEPECGCECAQQGNAHVFEEGVSTVEAMEYYGGEEEEQEAKGFWEASSTRLGINVGGTFIGLVGEQKEFGIKIGGIIVGISTH